MPMFYGFNHPIYQEIEYRDLKTRASCPEKTLEFLKNNRSFSTHGELNHQGADFNLEGKIKRMKMMAPKDRLVRRCGEEFQGVWIPFLSLKTCVRLETHARFDFFLLKREDISPRCESHLLYDGQVYRSSPISKFKIWKFLAFHG